MYTSINEWKKSQIKKTKKTKMVKENSDPTEGIMAFINDYITFSDEKFTATNGTLTLTLTKADIVYNMLMDTVEVTEEFITDIDNKLSDEDCQNAVETELQLILNQLDNEEYMDEQTNYYDKLTDKLGLDFSMNW